MRGTPTPLRMRAALVAAVVAIALPAATEAQNGAPASDGSAVRRVMMDHFNSSMEKFIALAEATPADRFDWKPQKDAMPVGQVYGHVARYNYGYLRSSMGVSMPAGIRADTLEAMRDKQQLIQLLKASAEHVRKSVGAMPAAQMDAETTLYGQRVPHWAVLVQLVAHMNEHLGQSIAYARANDVVPPWSR